MTAVETSPLIRKLSAFATLSTGETALMQRLHRRRKTFVSGRDLVHQGQSEQAAYILAEGWVCSYKLQADGSRQIVDFQIPGDFLGLRSLMLRVSDHSFEPIGSIQASEIMRDELLDTLGRSPRLAAAILWAASRDEAMVVEHLVSVARRDADVRLAHFLLELSARLALVGIGGREGYACPLTQYHLADALGLSAIHVNRILRRLREDRLVTFRGGIVRFDDYDRLLERADFDPAYLDHGGPVLG
ncbi:cAMP-binding domain of CRP or a regulatory subunit of cAMP-dependent protein kinases [Tranquillimonas rosea]|uniref:cAMP-binding domain of CRP or a regulatory subunit of cAMP-dependent protein kinases n=1 Tax=Tranquillimonas rosea TaxID=641238 RepID=A0A1H9SRB5_9RHOB|nr:Crp/Fnr family transcriptional regulator [Tranquillimonas rosea]SER87550.1 cAMP-binding domain of CRP or a regulatory subunit of cAMP-dependent protein kinases [Tranquillimonas rosea]